ncbi:DUF3090 family protein [Candidatus Lucifugimonas marina]|uniref:DUF3090 family protein n=1 Tax=Candidatus Lucifugimonas marina TaxID=3038979 RepID=A0AAJ6CS95_9CHLR|nr:DUF3090 family protein [SAR202 cluster bacterium JH702]MDG0870284.1 DUF3090 family protein [SAR202 cluster bacterium JH639]WFG36155.1 DUF3090 family protein [SAR202 cluster bacterium JH545]WFG40101.1 DUF3090 family protein [SAR202 cluster bacterium JH1073]
MSEFDRNDLGLVDYIHCEAIGEPGRRTFNITARSVRGETIVWMEKEQLYQVGISLRQFLATRETPPDPAPFPEPPIDSPVPVHVEFKTGDMSLQHDPASDVFTLVASDIPREESGNEPLAEITFSFERSQAEEISKRSVTVVAAGRKPCPLCEAPLNRGEKHFCVKVNGYNPTENPMDMDKEHS